MNCYTFTSHFTEQPIIEDFIVKIHSLYNSLNEDELIYSVHQKIVDNKLLVILNTDNLKIARVFIDYFVEYEHFLEEPKNL
jgi:hypothetical protein